MHVMILTTDRAAPNPAAGQPLRGTTDTCERGRRVAYLVGAMTHQCSRRAVIAEIPLEPSVVERALLTSYGHAFPGLELDPETLAGIREVLGIAARFEPGSVVTPTSRGFSIRSADAASVSEAEALAPGATKALLALAEGCRDNTPRLDGWPIPACSGKAR